MDILLRGSSLQSLAGKSENHTRVRSGPRMRDVCRCSVRHIEKERKKDAHRAVCNKTLTWEWAMGQRAFGSNLICSHWSFCHRSCDGLHNCTVRQLSLGLRIIALKNAMAIRGIVVPNGTWHSNRYNKRFVYKLPVKLIRLSRFCCVLIVTHNDAIAYSSCHSALVEIAVQI